MSLSIALHLGAHKTATTHLQRLLGQSWKSLADRGVAYLGPAELRAPGLTLRDRFGLAEATERGTADPRAELERIAPGGHRVILSEENFAGTLRLRGGGPIPRVYPMAGKKVARLVRAVDPVPVDIFLAIRNPVDYVASYYSQALQMGAIQTLEAFLAANPVDRIDWVSLVRRLRRQTRARSVTVWRFEDYRALLKEILTRLIADGRALRIAEHREPVNSGMSEEAVRAVLAWHAAGREGDLVSAARSLYPIDGKRRRYRPFSESEIAASRSWYADQVARIAGIDGVTLLTPSHGGG